MPQAPLKITVLGSGTSMGVPSLGCHCRVCSSLDPHDNRLRPSLLLSRNGQNVVIDTTPDFRQQGLRAGVDRLDAVLLTHGHADHIMGFDDIRPYNLRQQTALPVYSNEETFDIIRRAFAYIFDGKPKLSSIPSVTLREAKDPFELLGITFTPIPLLHGDMDVLGFRFGRAAYLTDFSSLPDSSLALLHDLDELIIDALRDIPHPMHQTVDQALALIKKLNPRRAWFTHIAHDLAHAETNERLRNLGYSNVQLAYDGLEIEVNVDESAAQHEASKSVATQPAPLELFSTPLAWSIRYGASNCGSTLAIGNFDGIHLGHQAILQAAVARAREINAIATALTFDPLPQKVLRPESAPLRVSTTEQRLNCFAAIGMDAAVVLPFTLDLAKLTPKNLSTKSSCVIFTCAPFLLERIFASATNRPATPACFSCSAPSAASTSSSFHRSFTKEKSSPAPSSAAKLLTGDVAHAARLLGRPFALSGKVVPGTGTGRRFTFPTLNLAAEQELLPARGVYVTRTLIEGESRTRRSVTNIGVRPTFNGSSLSVETHVLEPLGEAPPARIEVEFWKRLREEKKFSGPEELRAQIALDISKANKFFTRLRRARSNNQAIPTRNT